MKRIKKLASLVLAMIMAMAMTMTAFATEGEVVTDTTGPTGSITISNTIEGAVYNVYRIFDLDSYDADKNAYLYYIADKWEGFFAEGAGAAYIKKTNEQDDKIYIIETSLTDANVAEFAKAALQYAKDNTIKEDGKETAENENGVTFSGLPLGYYLVDSSVGTVCSLDTLDPNATIVDKNQHPGNEKEVEEDSEEDPDKKYGKENDADINQIVNFHSTITIPNVKTENNNAAGVENLIFHDKMTAGLTWDEKVSSVTLNGKEVEATNYTVVKGSAEEDDCTFEVVFTKDFNDSLEPGDKIVISYSAELNESAVIGVEGNPNDSKITYGEDNKFKTEWSETVTKTWEVKIFKHDSSEEKNGLAGAVFTLSKSEDGSNPIRFVKGENEVYWMAKDDEEGTTEIVTVDRGKFTIKGLDSDTYYLTEIKAPEGYNQLANPIVIIIDKEGNVTYDGEAITDEIPEVSIENQSGTLLPSTGGIGTTIFYVVGGILVVGAGILLVVKKRMSAR